MPALLISVALTAAALLAFPVGASSGSRLLRLTLAADGSGTSGRQPTGPRTGRRFLGLLRGGLALASSDTSTGLRDPAMVLELVAAMLQSGSGLGRALELVAAVAADDIRGPLRPVVSALAIGADWDTAWGSNSRTSNSGFSRRHPREGGSHRHPDILLLRDALAFAAYTGAPSAAILYAQAARIRRDRFRLAEKRAAALGVKLVIPLGLCSLPAFICLGVVPVLLALVPSAG